VGLPTELSVNKADIEEFISHDKKASGEKITVVKCDEIGSFYFEKLTVKEIMNLI
jgi:3-dehydroquinate synthetase